MQEALAASLALAAFGAMVAIWIVRAFSKAVAPFSVQRVLQQGHAEIIRQRNRYRSRGLNPELMTLVDEELAQAIDQAHENSRVAKFMPTPACQIKIKKDQL